MPTVGLRDGLRNIKSNHALQMLGLTSVTYLVGLFTLVGTLIYYARDVLGDARYMSIFGPLLFGMFILVGWTMPALIRVFGKARLFQIVAALGVIGGVLFFLATADTVWVAIIGAVFLGLSSGTANALMWNFEADTVEYGEWKTGLRTEGTTYAVFSFMRKLAQAIGGAIGVWIIGWFGYQGGLDVQSEDTLTGIKVAVGLIPAVLYAASIVLMQFYPLKDDRHRMIIAELEGRDTERGSTKPSISTN